MIYSRADLPHIKWSLLIFLSSLSVGGTAIVTSTYFVTYAQHEQQAAQHQLITMRSQFTNANEDSKNMKAYTFEYGELLRRNILGNDQRMDWIENLEKIRKQHRVLDFKYSIAPQRPYTSLAPLDSGNFEINMSDMTLQFDLLHENQLMDFFDSLRADISGWFIIDHCVLERSNDSDATAQLKATCTGGWLTLKNRSTK